MKLVNVNKMVIPEGEVDHITVNNIRIWGRKNIEKLQGYIAYLNHRIFVGNYADNCIAVIPISPSKTYEVSMHMYGRFRIGTYTTKLSNSDATPNVYISDTLDTNGDANDSGIRTLRITSSSEDHFMYIFYWTQKFEPILESDIRNTILVKEVSK